MAIVQKRDPAPAPQTEDINPRAQMGGNEPPLEERIAMEFREALLSERPNFTQRVEDAIAAVDRAEVTDAETLGKAGDLDKILRAAETHITDTHKAVKQPYLDGGRACDTQKAVLLTPITGARASLRDRMNRFLAQEEAKRKAEQARIAAEQRAAEQAAERARQEAREAEEAAAKAAAAATSEEEREAAAAAAVEAQVKAEEAIAAAPLAAVAPRAAPIRSDLGSTVSGRKVWQSEVVDYQVAFMAVEDNPKVREAIDKAVAQLVKAGKRNIDGVKIWQAVEAVTR